MKIGKFKKIAAIGLALTMAIGLLYTSGTVNATNDQVQSDQTLSIDDIDKPISVYTNAGPIIRQQKSKKARLASQEDNGVVLNKDAVYNPKTDMVDITLESYATGSITTTGKSLDIVLVLDQSGSMSQNKLGDGRDAPTRQKAMKTAVDQFVDDLYDSVKDLENMTHNVGIVTFSNNATTYAEMVDIKESCTKRIDNNWYPVRFDTGYDYIINRIDSLGRASGATNTGAGLEEAEEMLTERWRNENDKVVIVFTDGVPTTQNAFSKGVAETALTSANNLKQNGATVYSIGVFDGADKSFLGSVYDENKTYEQNADSFFDDNDFGENKRANRFMNLLSSNTPYSQSGLDLGIEEDKTITIQRWVDEKVEYKDVGPGNGDYNWSWHEWDYVYVGQGNGDYIKNIIPGHFEEDEIEKTVITNNYNCNNAQDPGYYLTADDSESLNKIFENIFDQTVVPKLKLSKDTVVTDVLSEYLQFPGDFDESDVKVYTSKYLGNGQFASENEDGYQVFNDADIVINGKSIKISNFEYDQNIVAEADAEKDIPAQGSKLIIKFSVEREPGFIGGNNVPTNNTSQSGISDKTINKGQFIEYFEEQNANIDMIFNTDSYDQSIYIGNQYNNFQEFITNGLSNIIYYVGNDDYKLGDTATNQYVDIVYTVKSEDNETVIGTYTVEAGKSTGTWILQDGFDTTGLENITKFNINVDVTSHIPNDQANDSRKAEIDNVTSSLESYLYIFAPELNSHDGELFLGNTENNLNQYVTVNEEGWYCTDTEAENVPQPKGAKPNLDIIVNGTDVSNNSFTPKNVGKYTFTYTVKNNGVPITVAKYNHTSEDSEHESCDKNDFIINVTGGTINLSKAINSIIDYPLQEDPIFIFKIEQVGNNEVNKTYYRVVRMEHKNDGSFDSSTIPAITGLPAGNYKVTELRSMRFGFVSATLNGEPKNTRSFEFQITENNPIVNISYKNELEFDDSFSDNDVVVNSFSKNEDGSIKITQDWLNKKGE